MALIRTYSGVDFDLLHPQPSMVCIADIAHSLAHLCRFQGHGMRFYSVAEHSLHVAYGLARAGHPVDVVRLGLLHDAAEAYCGDVVTPLKRLLPDYSRIEKNIERLILEKFHLSGVPWDAVKDIDEIMYYTEAYKLLPKPPEKAPRYPLTSVTIECWEPAEAKARFMMAFERWFTSIPNGIIEI